MQLLLSATLAILLSSSFTSCKEASDEVEEYANWQQQNEEAFLLLYNEALSAIAAGRSDWKLLLAYSTPDSSDVVPDPTDYVVVKVVDEGEGTTSPYFTDMVKIHYLASLLPSPSYPEGYEIDHSYVKPFDPASAYPAERAISESYYDTGLATALQHMHKGDHWIVYIPSDLAFGSESTTIVPAYSMLIYEIILVDFYPKDESN